MPPRGGLTWLQSPALPLPRLHARYACSWTLLRVPNLVASSHRADDCVLCARCATDHRTLKLKFDGCARSSHCVLAGLPRPSLDRTVAASSTTGPLQARAAVLRHVAFMSLGTDVM